MRITVSHTKSKEEIMRAVDRSFDDLSKGIAALPVKFVNEQKSWQGSGRLQSPAVRLLDSDKYHSSIDVWHGFPLVVEISRMKQNHSNIG